MRGIGFLLAMSVCGLLSAQPGSVDLSFVPELETNFHVQVIAEQKDGKLLVGGRYDAFDSHRLALLRLNADGTQDRKFRAPESFTAGAFGFFGVRQLRDGKILATGTFQKYQDESRPNLVLFRRNGRLSSQIYPELFNLNTLAIRSDGSVFYRAPNPYVYNGSALKLMSARGELTTNCYLLFPRWYHIELLQASPNSDVVFGVARDGSNPQKAFVVSPSGEAHFLSPPLRGRITSCAIVDERTVYVGGWISLGASYRILRFHDYGWDANFVYTPADPRESAEPPNLAAQNDGKVLHAAWFYRADRGNIFRLERLNTDGTRDPTFLPALPDDLPATESVRMLILKDRKILIAGEFLQFGGLPRNRLVRLLP